VAIASQILLGYSLLMHTTVTVSWLCALTLFLTAVYDALWTKKLRESSQFMMVLVEMVGEILMPSSTLHIIIYSSIVVQCFYLLWWAATLVSSLKVNF
jgi:hypothetical protein